MTLPREVLFCHVCSTALIPATLQAQRDDAIALLRRCEATGATTLPDPLLEEIRRLLGWYR